MVRHNGAVNHIFAEFDLLSFHPDSAFLQSAPSSSDISVWQFLAPVLDRWENGRGRLRNRMRSVAAVSDHASPRSVTLIELVPVVMNELLDYANGLSAVERTLPDLRVGHDHRRSCTRVRGQPVAGDLSRHSAGQCLWARPRPPTIFASM